MRGPGSGNGVGWLYGVTLVLLVAGGCMNAGPDYKTPAVGVPTGWSTPATGAVMAGPLDPVMLTQWWSVFCDPVLTGLVARAREKNLDIMQAEARLREARAQRLLAGAGQLPEVSVNASASRARSSSKASAGGIRSNYAQGLDASWELDLFGAKRRGVEAAEATLQASQEALHDVHVSLLAEVALNYVQLRSCQTRLAILSTNLASQADTYAITCWRHEANLVTQLDVDQARVSLEQTRAELPVLRTMLAKAEHQRALLLGEAPGNLTARLAEGPPVVPVAATELAVGVPADVLRQRPDVRHAERTLAARTAQTGVATASRYPDLTLSGSIGLEALVLGDLYTAGARTAQGLVKAGLSLFDGGRIRQTIAIQTALQEEALAAYEASILAALQEVEDALVAYANEQSRQRSLQEAAAAGLSAFTLARSQYESGLVDFQTVLTSQQSLLTVQDSLAASQADMTADLIRLYKALGGGWTPVAPEVTVRKTTKEQEGT